MQYLPESMLSCPIYSKSMLMRAIAGNRTLCAHVTKCSRNLELIVPLGDAWGMIPPDEAALEGENTKEIAIMSRVGKKIVCKVLSQIDTNTYLLSRKKAQLEAKSYMLSAYTPGSVISCVVTHLESYGLFTDIGYGLSSFIGLRNISVARITHPSERFTIGQKIHALVTGCDEDPFRIYLSHKELLGTWEENVCGLEVGDTVEGIVRSVVPYGIFIELKPNLVGLAEYQDGLTPGTHVSVVIKSIAHDTCKIKLIIISEIPAPLHSIPIRYYFCSDPLSFEHKKKKTLPYNSISND